MGVGEPKVSELTRVIPTSRVPLAQSETVERVEAKRAGKRGPDVVEPGSSGGRGGCGNAKPADGSPANTRSASSVVKVVRSE
jgi:hypothetical protein